MNEVQGADQGIWVVGRDGTIAYKLVGPITPQNVDRVLKAEIEKALK